jgi:cytochrome c553
MRSLSASSILVPLALSAPLLLVPACSDDPGTTGGSTGSTTSAAATSSAGSGGSGGATSSVASSASGTGGSEGVTSSASSSASGTGGGGPAMVTEKLLDVKLTLTGNNLTIAVKDGATPVMTDAWLYTLQNGTTLVPLTEFADPAEKRKYRGLMMPCTLTGQPSGLTPCFKGELNGVMTDVRRAKHVGGVNQSTIDGTNIVPLTNAPVDPIVVLVGVEDQRYAGVAAIDKAGNPVAAPAGLPVLETHVARTYADDAAPIINTYCISCHGKDGTFSYMPMDTYDQVTGFDFGRNNGILNCDKQFPNDPTAHQTCVDAITNDEFYFEFGAPAVSPAMRRARPDEQKSVSPEGLAWYGGTSRFSGAHGDRRMPPQNTTADMSDDLPNPTYFDKVPGDYQVLFDWVAQGMKP